jgi:large subunit ribosomal protein L23
MDKFMSLKPRLTEKAYAKSKDLNTYVFDVPAIANKQGVATAVQAQYDVKVTDVKIAVIKGKNKRTFVSRRGKFVKGTRSDIKKAYVTLKDGDKLPIFAAEEEAEAKEQKAAEKAAKKASKEKK